MKNNLFSQIHAMSVPNRNIHSIVSAFISQNILILAITFERFAMHTCRMIQCDSKDLCNMENQVHYKRKLSFIHAIRFLLLSDKKK